MESTRLLLRNFIENDAEGCFDNFGKDKSSGRFIPLFPMKDANEMEQFVKSLIPNHNAWILIEKSTQQAVGFHQDGRLRDRRIDLVSGDRSDLVICSMTKDEYMERGEFI